MHKRLALLVALLALALGAKNAAAAERQGIDNRLRAASISVGAASTAVISRSTTGISTVGTGPSYLRRARSC